MGTLTGRNDRAGTKVDILSNARQLSTASCLSWTSTQVSIDTYPRTKGADAFLGIRKSASSTLLRSDAVTDTLTVDKTDN